MCIRDSAYANTVPNDLHGQKCLVLDPMLATGGSLAHTVELLENANAGEITVACVLASPEGLALMEDRYPNVGVWTAAIDLALNDVGFIRPGLGDAGDRQLDCPDVGSCLCRCHRRNPQRYGVSNA